MLTLPVVRPVVEVPLVWAFHVAQAWYVALHDPSKQITPEQVVGGAVPPVFDPQSVIWPRQAPLGQRTGVVEGQEAVTLVQSALQVQSPHLSKPWLAQVIVGAQNVEPVLHDPSAHKT